MARMRGTYTQIFTRDFLHISYPLCPIPSTRWLSITTSCGSKLVLDRMRRNPFGPWQRSCHQRMVERSSWIWNHRKQSRASRSWTMPVRIPRRSSLTLFTSTTIQGLAEHKLRSSEKHAFSSTLTRLAGKHARLPNSMIITDKIDFSASSKPHTSGGFVDIKPGQYEGCTVAVKTLRVATTVNFDKIREVRRFL